MDVQDATATHYCKHPGCTNEVASRVGRYSYCAEHQGRSQAAKASAGATTEQRIKSLAAAARAVDRAKAKEVKLTTEALAARTAAREAQERFSELVRETLAGAENGDGS